MKKIISLVILLSFLTLTFLFTGCADVDESTIPWSRPKDWEGGVPGLGGTM